MFPPEGNIGCVVDPELALDSRSPAPAFYLNHSAAPASDTPDTSFYQWVPFILVFQVLSIFYLHVLPSIYFTWNPDLICIYLKA